MSDAWKALERFAAARLCGERVLRGADFSEVAPDVWIPDFPHWKVDCKYRSSSWKHHTLLKECRTKYCTDEHDVPVLITRCRNEKCQPVVSMHLDDLAGLITAIRALRHEVHAARGRIGPDDDTIEFKIPDDL